MPTAKPFDAAIAGGGLIGAAIAWELARAGLHVAVFDRAEPGREASWASAGILSPAPENPAMLPLVPLGLTSLRLYPEWIAKLEAATGLPTGYRTNGTLEVLLDPDTAEALPAVVARHRSLGLACELLSPAEARKLEPALGEAVHAAALRPEEASVDPRLLTAAVLEAARRSGVAFFPGSAVQAIWREADRCDGVVTSAGKFSAKTTIIAAGCFSAGIEGAAAYAPVRPAKGQMVALRPPGPAIKRVLWSEHIYLVPRTALPGEGGRILAGATVEYTGFEKSVTPGAVQSLIEAAIALAPGLAGVEILETWAGLRPDSPDHLPILGPTDIEGLFIATGHFRSGILLAPITARLLRDWLTGESRSLDADRRPSLDTSPFSPLRFGNSRDAASGLS